ncbi:DUF6702 family protein [Sphingobacterium suaedae]|uniref:DUF6702 family protein n=1 Tax=Sphingobacterium suaedae TaxID=1686402 RepID=A0ABW5KKH3_9SPHI
MNRRFFIFVVLNILSLSLQAKWRTHPFYVSVCTLEWNAKTRALEISCRIFYDDLEEALRKEGYAHDDILQPRNKAKLHQGLAAYLQQNFRIKVDNQIREVQFLGYQIEEDAAWCYMEVNDVEKVTSLGILNSILYQQHTGQTNIIHATVLGKRQSTKLQAPKNTAVFQY